jgi:hypothetical protein
LWGSHGAVTIRDIEDNLFMAVFNTQDDLERIFVQSPWTFDKKLIQIIRFENDMQPSQAKFRYSAFWVRILNLAIKSMIREVGEDIGNVIGNSLEVDVPEDGIGWGRYLRIRVELDVTQPLLRGMILEYDDSAPFWVDFQYEHLPIFCYRCGLLGHNGNDCVVGRRSGEVPIGPGEHFGSWLRALPRHRSVPGPQRGHNHHFEGEHGSSKHEDCDTSRREGFGRGRASAADAGVGLGEDSGAASSIPQGPVQLVIVPPNPEDNAHPIPEDHVTPIQVEPATITRSSGSHTPLVSPLAFQVDDRVTGEGQLFQDLVDTGGSGIDGLHGTRHIVHMQATPQEHMHVEIPSSDTKPISGPVSTKPNVASGNTRTWKKRARNKDVGRSTVSVTRAQGKRSLSVFSNDNVGQVDAVLETKIHARKKQNVGITISDGPQSVEAVEQPRRAQ